MEQVLIQLAQRAPELVIFIAIFYCIAKWQNEVIKQQIQGTREDNRLLGNDYEALNERLHALSERVVKVEILCNGLREENVDCRTKTAYLKAKLEDVMVYLKLTKKRDDPKQSD